MRFTVAGRPLMVAEAPGVHPVDDLARQALPLLPARRGDRVLDLGCGTGVYGLAALLLGASELLLTDLDPRAVRCALGNARRNRLRGVSVATGDLFAPCRRRRFDLIIANLPQTPGPMPFLLSKWGGRDGTLHLRRFFREAPRHLRPGGRVFFLLHDLCDSRRVARLARRRFRLSARRAVRREFSPAEYDAYHPGLFAYLDGLRRRRVARFHGRGRRRWFRLRFLVATLRGS